MTQLFIPVNVGRNKAVQTVGKSGKLHRLYGMLLQNPADPLPSIFGAGVGDPYIGNYNVKHSHRASYTL